MSDGPLGGPVVREWLESLRERFEHDLAELRAIPGLVMRVYSAPVGSRSDFQGHDVGIEVTLGDGESLVLSVTAAYLTTVPRLSGCLWGLGNVVTSTWDADGSHEWPVATAEHVAHVERDLPRLVTAMRDAIARGRPGRRTSDPKSGRASELASAARTLRRAYPAKRTSAGS